jgi:hypothetical protein
MVRDIRMAGFGRIDSKTFGASGMHGKYKNIVTPNGGGGITVVAGYQQMTTLAADAASGTNTIQVVDASGFTTTGPKEYICVNGTESHRVKKITGNQITFFDDGNDTGNLVDNHYGPQAGPPAIPGEPVFLVKAISYSVAMYEGKLYLLRDENLGPGPQPQPVAENIESMQFTYTLKDLTVYTNDVPNPLRDQIRMVQVTIVARTDMLDKDLLKASDGYRRRTLRSEIQLRNLISL